VNHKKTWTSNSARGVTAAMISAGFLGFTPVFGKVAISCGFSPYQVVALRTVFALVLLTLSILIINPQLFYIYPAGLFGCLLAGLINGIGSLFYYRALSLINANIGQLIYMSYPMFVILWMWLEGHPPSKLTLFRLSLILIAITLLVYGATTQLNYKGLFLMLIAGAFYAVHLPINQRVLFEMPAPTVTFYTILAMSLIVFPFWIFIAPHPPSSQPISPYTLTHGWIAVILLAVVTFLSRLTLFMGVKRIGGVQTALLGVTELLISLCFSKWWLKETLSYLQWIGVFLLILSICLVIFEKRPQPKPGQWGLLTGGAASVHYSKTHPQSFD
jgi:drug/metabolite transporter (DMT)-like permease